jgi:hypothetical protein
MAPRVANMTTFQFGRMVFAPHSKNVAQTIWNAKSRCCLIRAAQLIHPSSGSMKTASQLRIPVYVAPQGLFFTNALRRQLYYLDHFKIVDRRQQLYQTIRLKLDQAEDKLSRLREKADMTAQQSLGEAVAELRKFMSPEQPYSAAAKCAIMALRGSYPVAEMVLLGS